MDKSMPRPWTAQHGPQGGFSIEAGDAILCQRSEWASRAEMSAANAALIVQAVNSHDELVGALDGLLKCRSVDILEESAREYPHGKEDVADIVAAFDRARAALALAKETT